MRVISQDPFNKDNIYTLGPAEAHMIIVPKKRERAVDQAKVAELAESIKAMGQLSPITVVKLNDGHGFRVVSGAHRVEAFRRIWAEPGEGIDKPRLICLHKYVAETDEVLIEIAENLHRNDLTAAERKAFAGRFGELMKVNGSGKSTGSAKSTGRGVKSWLTLWSESTNTPAQTARDWWKQYQVETGETRTPAKAEDAKDAFFAWLQTAKERQEQAKQDAEANKQRAEAEKAAKAKAKRAAAVTAAVKAMKDAGDTDLEILEACNAGGLNFEPLSPA